MLIYIFWDLPNPRQLTTHPAPASTKLLDRNGKLIYEIFSVGRRTPIKLDTLPKYVWQATIAIEDRDFYSHSGFSIRGISRALFSTFFRQRLQGGSTITQQLVKKALLVDDRTIRRKARELVLSLAVENLYDKDEILELYLNQIPYGGTAYGLEAASNAYFGKPATGLTLPEAALLAALPQAPSYYSPFGSRPELGLERQRYILGQMLDAKFISQEEHDVAVDTELVFSSPPVLKAPHFSLWVKDKLIEKYGIEKVEQDGLTVITTLDLELQNFAQDTVASEVAKLTREKVGNGAALITNPKTGEILSMVGSKNYFNVEDDGNVNVTLAKRQPGSAIKPITYSLGIEHHSLTASTLLADKATCFSQSGQEIYCPQNYDVQFHGPTQVRFALGNSFNIPAVKALVMEGLGNFVASASAFGLTTYTDPTKYGPSIALGGGEVTMLDLSTAYGVLANAGKRVDLNPILVVSDRNDKILEQVKSREVSSDKEPTPYSEYKIQDTRYAPSRLAHHSPVGPHGDRAAVGLVGRDVPRYPVAVADGDCHFFRVPA
ncbi:MAG: transglycosylase domain-containing protein, partial [Patescibacteria group bacterium]